VIRPVARRASAPVLAAAALFGAGIATGAQSVGGELLAFWLAALALAGALIVGSRLAATCAALFFLAAGFAAGRLRVRVSADRAAVSWSRIDPDRPVRIVGILRDFWTGPEGRRRTRLAAESIEQSGRILAFSAPVALSAFGQSAPPGVPGDRIRATVSLEEPEDPVSTRDLPAPWRSYRATLKSGWQAAIAGRTPASIAGAVNDVFARRLFSSGLPRREVIEPVAALLLGRAGDLDASTQESIRQGGFAHVLLASGLQVGIFALLLHAALAAAGIARRRRDLAMLAGIALFWALGGGGPSVSRVALTLAFLLVSRLVEKPVSPLQALGASALVVLGADPAGLWRFGFWLTYAAAVAIILAVEPLSEALAFLPAGWRRAAAVTFAAQLAVAPLVLWRFNAVQPLSWIASPLAAAAAGALMIGGFAVLGGAVIHAPTAVPAAGFSLVFSAVERLAAFVHRGSFLATTPPLAAVLLLLAIAGLGALLGPRLLRLAALALFLALFGVLAVRRGDSPRRDELSIEALDVGQGDAFLLRSGASAFLVDGGGSFAGTEDFGRVRLLPKLLDRGVRRLDGVLLSHPHPDHAAGLVAVLREMPTDVFLHGNGDDDGGWFARLDAEAVSAGRRVRVVATGERLAWAGGQFDVLRSGGRRFKKDAINNESVVLLYSRGNRRVLMTGDAGIPAEQEILSAIGAAPRVDVLKVGHHGSRTSSGGDFVSAFAPHAALLSCGRRNRFRHPSPETLATFARLGIPVFRTDLRSDVGILLTPQHRFLRERGRP
jgi:competence protein ComEC